MSEKKVDAVPSYVQKSRTTVTAPRVTKSERPKPK